MDPMNQGNNMGTTPDAKDLEENKLWAVLAYFGILSVVVLLVKKDSAYAHFHAKQGLAILAGGVISVIPVLGWIIGVITLVFFILGIMNALGGKMNKLPVVGDMLSKLNI